MPADLEKIKRWGADNLVGMLAITAGLILLAITYKIIINLVIFSIGMAFVYFGLARLKIKVLTDFLDNLGAKLKSFLAK